MAKRASTRQIDRFKSDEGFRDRPYECEAGKWTIGHGHVILPEDSFSYPISREFAHDLLMRDLEPREDALTALLTREPNQNQFDAMLSLVYNAGVGYRDGKKGDFADSDLLNYFNAGQIADAANEFLEWTKYRDPITHKLTESRGLKLRRERERELFLS